MNQVANRSWGVSGPARASVSLTGKFRKQCCWKDSLGSLNARGGRLDTLGGTTDVKIPHKRKKNNRAKRTGLVIIRKPLDHTPARKDKFLEGGSMIACNH